MIPTKQIFTIISLLLIIGAFSVIIWKIVVAFKKSDGCPADKPYILDNGTCAQCPDYKPFITSTGCEQCPEGASMISIGTNPPSCLANCQKNEKRCGAFCYTDEFCDITDPNNPILCPEGCGNEGSKVCCKLDKMCSEDNNCVECAGQDMELVNKVCCNKDKIGINVEAGGDVNICCDGDKLAVSKIDGQNYCCSSSFVAHKDKDGSIACKYKCGDDFCDKQSFCAVITLKKDGKKEYGCISETGKCTHIVNHPGTGDFPPHTIPGLVPCAARDDPSGTPRYCTDKEHLYSSSSTLYMEKKGGDGQCTLGDCIVALNQVTKRPDGTIIPPDAITWTPNEGMCSADYSTECNSLPKCTNDWWKNLVGVTDEQVCTDSSNTGGICPKGKTCVVDAVGGEAGSLLGYSCLDYKDQWVQSPGKTGVNTQCQQGNIDPSVTHYQSKSKCIQGSCAAQGDACCVSGFTYLNGKCYEKKANTEWGTGCSGGCGSPQQECGPSWRSWCHGNWVSGCTRNCCNNRGFPGMDQFKNTASPTNILVPHCQCSEEDKTVWYSVGDDSRGTNAGGCWNFEELNQTNYKCVPGQNDMQCEYPTLDGKPCCSGTWGCSDNKTKTECTDDLMCRWEHTNASCPP